MPFRALGLDARILQAIQEAGYSEPTPIQAAAIPPILAGNDLIGIAQTGTGKTAAFTLPILDLLSKLVGQGPLRGIKCLILAPTRELVVQIKENVEAYAKHLPLRVTTIFGGVSERPQIQALRNGVDLVIATPGRLMDLMAQRHVNMNGLEFLVLDEADRMLDMGFLPNIKRIVKALPVKRQTLLFSATLSKEIEALTHEFQRHPKIIQIGKRSNPAETVTQLVYEVPKHLKPSLLLHLLVDPSFNMVLVFSKMKHSADRIARYLEKFGVKTATLHSNRSQNQRLKALTDFKSGAVRVLVATDIAARGIDVDGISHVVNFDFPAQPEDYVHRIGRTGRAQAIGDAISFITGEDQGALRALERFIGRGIVRKRADGFDYSASPPPPGPDDERERRPRQGQGGRPQQRSNSAPRGFGGGGGGGGQRSGGNGGRGDSGPRGSGNGGGGSSAGGSGGGGQNRRSSGGPSRGR
jgi:ATP-dependent RNA helicase RhlE